MSRAIGEDISRVMREQAALEARFEALVSERDALKAMNNPEPFRQNKAELAVVASDLRATTTRLCEALRENPDVNLNIAFAQAERAKLQALLSATMVEIEETGAFPSLLKHLADLNAEEAAIRDAALREREVSAAVRELRSRLVTEKEEHAKYLAEKAEVMEAPLDHVVDGEPKPGLKASLAEKKKATGADLRYERKKLAAESECLARMHAQRLDGLRAEIDATRREIAAEEQTHAETVAFLERRNAELNATVLEWEERHRDDKERKTKELSEVKAAIEELTPKLEEWEEKYRSELELHEARVKAKAEWEASAEEREKKEEIHARAAKNAQMLYAGVDEQRKEKIAAKEAAKAEKEAEKGKKKGK